MILHGCVVAFINLFWEMADGTVDIGCARRNGIADATAKHGGRPSAETEG